MTTPQLTDDELQDLAHSAYEEAMSLGLSVDTFLRYFKGIRNRLATQAQGQDAAPAEQPSCATKDMEELQRLRALIHQPHTADWMQAVELEAAHQQERWGAEHDEGKQPQDWFWLLGYLSGKAVAAFGKGDKEKGLHHIVSSGAVLLNWHRNVTGLSTSMRPGIDAARAKE